MPQQNPVLKFEPGQSHTIALKYKTGKPFRRGDHQGYTYSLTSGHVAFLPAEADAAIQALHVDAGEPFKVCFRMDQGKPVWDVERIAQSGPVATVGNGTAPDAVNSAGLSAASSLPHAITNAKPAALPPSLTTEESRRLFRQLCATIEAVQAAENFAKGIGRPIQFEPADVRSMAITGFIQQSRSVAA